MPQITQKQKDACQIIIEKEIPKFIELSNHALLNCSLGVIDNDLVTIDTNIQQYVAVFNECEALSATDVTPNTLAILVDKCNTKIKDTKCLAHIDYAESYLLDKIQEAGWCREVVAAMKQYRNLCINLDTQLLAAAGIEDEECISYAAGIEDEEYISYTSALIARCSILSVDRFSQLFFTQFILAPDRVKLTTRNKEDIVLATIERLAIYKPCLVDMAITRNQFDELAKDIVEALK